MASTLTRFFLPGLQKVRTDDTDETLLPYDEVARLAFRALRRLGVPESNLGDAVQEVLCVVHRRQQDFRGESSVRTWVFGIALRVASSYRRRQRNSEKMFDTESGLVEQTASTGPSPFAILERREASRLLYDLLEELPDELRAVFVLIELEELTLAEAADALGLPSSTCKSHLRRARLAFNAKVARERAKKEWSGE